MKQKNRYDKVVGYCKNNIILVALFIFLTVIGYIASFTDAIKSIKGFLYPVENTNGVHNESTITGNGNTVKQAGGNNNK